MHVSDPDQCTSKSLCGEDQSPANGYCIEKLGASYDCLCYPGKTGLLCDTGRWSLINLDCISFQPHCLIFGVFQISMNAPPTHAMMKH